MLNSISIIPSSQDEVTSSADGMNWDATTSVNGTPARGNSPRTFLMKASRFLRRIETAEGLQSRSRVCCCLMATDPGRIDFSADVRCTAVYDESSRRVSRARFHSFRNSLVDL